MTDLVDDGDRLHALATDYDGWNDFTGWVHINWPAIAAALRERDELTRLLHVAEEAFDIDTEHAAATIDALRVRAETAEAANAAMRDAVKVGGQMFARLVDAHANGRWSTVTRVELTLVARALEDAAHATAVEGRP